MLASVLADPSEGQLTTSSCSSLPRFNSPNFRIVNDLPVCCIPAKHFRFALAVSIQVLKTWNCRAWIENWNHRKDTRVAVMVISAVTCTSTEFNNGARRIVQSAWIPSEGLFKGRLECVWPNSSVPNGRARALTMVFKEEPPSKTSSR